MTTGRDTNDFAELLRQHERQLFGYIFSLVRNLQDTEDLFQQTCLALWEQFDQFDPGTNFVAWACTVARYRALKFFEREPRRHVPFSPEAHEQLIAVQAEWSPPELEARREALAACVEKLGPAQRDLLWKCYDREHTVRQVAAELGRTTHSVYSSLRHSRRLLLDCIRATLAQQEHKPHDR